LVRKVMSVLISSQPEISTRILLGRPAANDNPGAVAFAMAELSSQQSFAE
jgi:hypothetical protein